MDNQETSFKKILTAVMLCLVISVLSIVAVTISFFFKPQSAYDLAVKNGFVGTEQQWIASLKGDTGSQGDQGEKGDQGSIGKSAYELAVENGFAGTKQQWLESLEGEDGDSAYDLAVEDGFNGTKSEWIASLKGEKGNKGDKGDTGDDGENAIAIEQITIDRLNAKLETISSTLSSKPTLLDRFNSANITNNQLKKLTSTYLYSYIDNEFIAVDGAGFVAYTTSDLSNYEIGKDVSEDVNLFTFVLSNNLSTEYSNYLVGGNATTLNITTGLEVGTVENITTINYTNTSNTYKNIVIRTNSANTNLNINAYVDEDDASIGDKITHFGRAGVVILTKVANSSYYENGQVAFVELVSGRIVLTKDSNVSLINIAKKDNNTYNNPIIVDGGVLEENMPEIISRDQVEITDERGKTELVVIQKLDSTGEVVSSETEQIYAYTNGTTGTTEKVTIGENKQNEEINSSLGIIVLDSESKAGEKAYGETKKDEKKQESVQDVIKASKYGGGRGTPASPYIINSIEHLYAMSEDYTYNESIEEYCNFECYKLMSDLTVKNWTIATIHYITLSESAVMPYCNAFGGQFDGNGHTIKFIWDSNVTEVDDNDGVALFGEFIDSLGIEGYDRPGVMKNLTIDCNIDANCDISPMFAYIWGEDCTIDNCHIKGTIKSEYYMAGISLYAMAENNTKIEIKNCVFDANVIVNVEENSTRNNEYYYLSTFISQTNLDPTDAPIVFENCTVNGSITLPYCADIDLVIYGTFYAGNTSKPKKCVGKNCEDNCTVNISPEYENNGKEIVKSELQVLDD